MYESDITPQMLWHCETPKTEVAIALHVWHIKKFNKWERRWGGFGKYALRNVVELVEKQKGLRIYGHSALAVTNNGIRLSRGVHIPT